MSQVEVTTQVDGATALLIGGRWTATATAFEVTDPATGEVLGRVADAGPVDAVAALDAAAAAAPGWRATPVEERALILGRAADLVQRDADRLADLMVAENGKPRREAAAEITNCVRTLRWSAEEARRAHGRVVPPAAHGPAFVSHVPVGPSFAISPWNFPASMLVRKLALALASGSPVIAKPSELTPLVGVALVELLHEAGVPAGALGLLTTTDPAGVTEALLADPRLRKVSFTGSTRVGLGLAAAAHGRLRRVSLELGGHSPAIVLPDADLEQAADRIAAAKFANAGQSCTAVGRVYVTPEQHDRLVELLAERAARLTVGHGSDAATDIGPLINASALAKVEAQVADAVARGARVVVGGAVPDLADPRLTGAYYSPTVLADVDHSMTVTSEETFGPVLPVLTYDDLGALLAACNSSEYGLAAYVFGQDSQQLWETATSLEYGVVGVNDPFPVRPELPFGGFRNSGQEREGGTEGIEAYLETTSISYRW